MIRNLFRNPLRYLPLALLVALIPVRAGSLLREVFTDIPGNALADLTNSPAYPNSPSETTVLTDFFEAPTDVLENYGQRLRGTFVAPVTGNYTFWVSSDDNGALFLSTDSNPLNSRLIAWVPEWSGSREWTKFAEQQSAPIRLVAGSRYYIEALQKEGGGGDNLAVRWLRPDGVDQGPIPLDNFVGWGLNPEAPRISQQPVPVTVEEGRPASFSVAYDNQGVVDVYWRRNGSLIPGVTGTTYVLDSAPLADDGVFFQAFLTNALGTTNSASVRLTVTRDTTRPTVVSALATSSTEVQVEFSEGVLPPAGAASANFSLNPALNVVSVAQDPLNSRRLVLTTAPLANNTTYTLTLSNVPDRAQTPNVVSAGSTVSFSTSATGPFVIEAEDFNFNSGQTIASASVMPYTGGAYAGRLATLGVDFQRGADASSPQYRNDNRIPMDPNTGDLVRGDGAWTMTTNFKLGWIGGGQWFNYTRTIPVGRYRVLASMSHGDSTPGALQASLQRVTAGATTSSQTLENLGTFVGDGTGGWGVNRLIPLRDGSGAVSTISLGGATTLRMNPSSGDFDYFILMPAVTPRITQHPVNTTVIEGRDAIFSVEIADNETASFQWLSNSVPIAGATGRMLTIPAAGTVASGARIRVAVGNDIGSSLSTEAVLTVTPDSTPPLAERAFNLGLTNIVLVFNEPVTVPAGPVASNFSIDGGATVSAAVAGAAPNLVNLSVSGLAFSQRYTITINNVRDRSAGANPVAANTRVSFFASELVPVNLGGNGAIAADVVRLADGGFDVSARGGEFGTAGDTGGYAWQQVSGNFDIRVRVQSLSITDPFIAAGLVARTGLETNSPFAGAFASAAEVGSYFSTRLVAGGGSTMSSARGGFPVNYPQTWLRLRRAGNDFTGFGSIDGTNWTQLGSASVSMPAQISLGLAVAGRDTNATALARFRDYGAATGATVAAFMPTREGLSVSSRRTRIVFSEIMYAPPAAWGGNTLEFVEIHNAGNVFEELGGWSITEGITYRFPAGFRLGAGQFAIIAKDPAAFRARYGIQNVLGPYDGNLNNAGELIQLRDELGALKLELEYGSSAPWPVAADGTGHSMVLINPSYGEADPRAWAASALIGGNPGDLDPVIPDPADTVVLNEFLVHTDLPLLDYVELYNHGNAVVDVSGCVITDNITTNKFRIPAGTTIPARGFLSYTETQLGFRLSSGGETVYLVNSNGLRVLDAVRFGGQENGVAFGRSPDGSGDLRRLSARTPGAANASWRVEDVIINEIMFNPVTQDNADEFVELHNRSGQAVDLAGWRLESAVDYTFPTGASIPAGGFVVVGADRSRLLANYTNLTAANTFGNWSGSLRNRGEYLALSKPDDVQSTNELGQVVTEIIHIVVSEVAYGESGRWGKWADGGGSSLELVDPRADTLRAGNWADSDETAKSQWQLVTFSDALRFGTQTPDRLHVGMLGEGECLVDDVQVLGPTGTALLANGGFESGTGTAATGWSFLGHHGRSRVENTGAFAGARVLHIIAPGDLDAGRNCIRANLNAGLNNGTQATIRARVRWLAGWPEVLFRTRGGGIEMTARMTVPKNLGTPGLPNSRLVSNTGPAIYAVNHSPAVPDVNQPVVVTARVSDPDGISSVSLRFRTADTGAYSSIAMRDDGLAGDAVAGDGLWSATLAGRSQGSLLQFRIEAFDGAATTVSSAFPSGAVYPGSAPVTDVVLRWGDPVPFGSFTHIHAWLSPTVDNLLQNGQDSPLVGGLDNTYRDATLVHGNLRVVYNAGIRRKGSPFTGQADYAMTVPQDDLLLGTADRVYGRTGNGGDENTRMRNQIANWFARKLGLPYLNTHYIRFYRNGTPHADVGEDLEQPSNYYAESWYPDGEDGDLRKIALAFEFRDDGGFDNVGADLGDYRNPNGQYNLSRYRFNWQGRPNGTTANDFTNFFALVSAANDRSTNYVPNLLNIADLEQWMRTFALDGSMGNWDTWGTGNSQNKYLYYQPGGRWRILPWDMDWVLGLGDPPSRRLFGGNDGNVNYMFDVPAFRRMAWRAYADAVNGPFLAAQYQPQFAARSAALAFNRITGIGSPNAIGTYLDARRQTVLTQLNQADTSNFSITSNGGADFSSATPTATLEGNAPFAAAGIRINGQTVPVEWTGFTTFRIRVPLTSATNTLSLVGVRSDGSAIPGFSDSITIRYTGLIDQPSDFVVINEINYDAVASGASYIELFNRATATSFDLSGYRLNGLGYTFPQGSIMPPGGYWVLARDRVAFGLAYGASVPVFDVFTGSLDNDGERIALVTGSETNEVIISDVRYANSLPWPTNAAGLGSSLQLIDASRGSWRVANWTATATNNANRVTPGRANAGTQALAAFPPLWINEVLPQNPSGPRDNAGDRDPFVEIYNAGTNTVDLTGLYLAGSFTDLTAWQFPAGTTIAAGGFLTVWADGEPAESIPGVPHTSFRLNPTNGSVSLVRFQGSPSAPAVMDYVTWDQIPPGRSFGAIPDGEPRTRRMLYNPTPGVANDPVFPEFRVVINEFMAQNNRTITDPADGDYDDWIELYNAGTNTVDLAGFYLTDRLTNSLSSMFRIPGGYPVPPGGFLLVWADNETQQNVATNRDLHANFALSRDGEQIGLFDPNGVLIDGFTFGPQTNDVSFGRYPDGVTPQLYAMLDPTPRGQNVLPGGNRPPVFNPLAAITAAEQTLVSFTAVAVDPDQGQTITYSLGQDAPPGSTIGATSGVFQWTPSESDGPGAFSFLIFAADNGSPARTGAIRVNISVTESNLPPVLPAVVDATVAEGSLLSLTLTAVDPDLPTNNLTFELVGQVPAGLVLSPGGLLTWLPDETFGASTQTISYRVTDDGSPARSASGQVRIVVLEVNNPPSFTQPAPQFVDEGTALALQLVAADPEGAAVRFSIDGTVPAGFQLNTDTGAVSWTPTEDQGPGNYVILIRATENTPDRLSTVRELLVEVREVNQAPVLASIATITVDEGAAVTFTASATDADRPAQQLRFSLEPGAPAGAFIDDVTGRFSWVTDDDAGNATNTITIRVTDNGPGLLSATRSFDVITRARFKVVINEVLRRPVAANTEFVELLNASARTAWDLSGLRLTGSNLNFTFPAGSSLAPGALVVVVRNETAFRAAYGVGATVAGVWTGAIGSVSDTLRIVRPGTGGGADSVLDRVDYAGSAPWAPSTNTSASSLQLVDARRDRNRAGNWAVSEGSFGTRAVVGFTDTWRYYQDGPPAGGSTWRDASYNDVAWPAGGGLLYVESAAVPTNKTTQLTLGQMTYYFRKKVVIPSLTAGVTVSIRTILDDGYVLWINGRRAHFQGMADNTYSHDTAANRVVGDAQLEGPFTISSEFLVQGENTFAVEVHQNDPGSSDIVFGMEMTLEGGTVSPSTPGLANNVTRPLPAFPTLRFNEVLARNTSGLRDASNTAEPWLEIVNTGVEDVSLDGLFLTDTDANPGLWAFPQGRSIPAGGFLVVFADGQAAQTTVSELHASFRLPSVAGTPIRLTLSRQLPEGFNPVDYIHTSVGAEADVSSGRLPDGEIASLLNLPPTPGASNDGATAEPPQLDVPTVDAAGVHITLRGATGRRYRVERANTLGTWSLLTEVDGNDAGVSVLDPAAGLGAARFYRAIDITP
jgi:hypothetical protein